MQKKRIGELDVFRFVFAMEVVLLHFQTGVFPFGGGVEFFFTLAGLLMARHAEKWERNTNGGGKDLGLVADETWSFMKEKFRSFYKFYFFAFAFHVIVRSILVNHVTAQTAVMRLLKSIPTLTLTFMAFTGREASNYIYVTWYMSAMLIAMFILYPILLRNYRFGVKVILPIVTLFLLGYQYVTYSSHNIASIDTWVGFTYSGILRAITEVGFGAILYCISTEITRNDAFMKRAQRPFLKIVFTLCRILCYGVALLYAHKQGLGLKFDRSFSMHALFFCGIGIMLSFSDLGWTIPDCKFTRYLGKISVPIYFFHKLLRGTWLNILGTEEVSKKYTWFMVVMCVFGSIVLMYVIELLGKGIQKLKAKRQEQLSA